MAAGPVADAYARHREAAGLRERKKSQTGRDIAEGYPGPGNLERRAASEKDLGLFLKTYFPQAFVLPWSPDHVRVISRMQTAILTGGLFALAMPRGTGKTSISVRAALWALLYRHRRFAALLGATERAARKLLRQVKAELSFNEVLAEDFRQVCYPVACLENNAQRCRGQLFGGEQTFITWGAADVVFPTMPDDACDGPNVSGSVVAVAGLTGAIRGLNHTLPSGEVLRPDVALLDDPQTRESATSVPQTEERLAIILGDVLGMAGPGKKITAVMPCTVIDREDVADQLLDRRRNPQWQGERTKMVYAFPANENLWAEYAEGRADELRNGGDGHLATEFYRQHQADMDAGAAVAWPERHHDDELSAVQHSMNLLYRLGRYAFFAEYQNEPIAEELEGGQLEATAIAARVNGLARGVVPLAATRLTAYVDVQQRLLYWLVVAWADDFTGTIVDYGTYPDQQRRYFALGEAQRTLGRAAPGAGIEGAIYAGLGKAADLLLGREWQREDGAALKINRLLVDSGHWTDTIFAWSRATPHAGVVMPSRGTGIGPDGRPMSEYAKKTGEQLGTHWLVTTGRAGKRIIRYLLIDVNFWKSFVAARLLTAPGDHGAVTLFGRSGQDHRMVSEHCCAEYRTETAGRGRTVDVWKHRAERRDNHLWDSLVGCAAAASLLGAALPGHKETPRTRRTVSYKEMYDRAKSAKPG